MWLNQAGRIRDCDGPEEKAHQGSMVQNVYKRFGYEHIALSVSKKYTNSLYRVGGVQKGGNINN